jgi:ATP-binding cassette, subfamily F, member 3
LKAKLTRDSATNAHIDPATGMFKEVKQVGTVAPPPPVESTHEIEGSLEPVTAPPKSSVKRLNPIKLKQLEDRVAAIENELPQLEDRIAQATQQQAVFTTADAAVQLAAELDALRERHAALNVEWEELGMQLEEQATA